MCDKFFVTDVTMRELVKRRYFALLILYHNHHNQQAETQNLKIFTADVYVNCISLLHVLTKYVHT